MCQNKMYMISFQLREAGYLKSFFSLDCLIGKTLNWYQQLCHSWAFLTQEGRHTFQSCFLLQKVELSYAKNDSFLISTYILKDPKTITSFLFVFKIPGEIPSEMTCYKSLELPCCENMKKNYMFGPTCPNAPKHSPLLLFPSAWVSVF